MSTAATYKIGSSSSDDTFGFGERLGKLCAGGEVIVLVSDLGGGKTTLAKGLAKGLGSPDIVSSPTFTVSQVYDGRDNLKIYHFDFYRLNDGGVVGYELAEIIDDPRAVVVIEWGDIIKESLPPRSVIIKLERIADGEDKRLITVNIPDEAAYLKGAAE